MSVDAKANLGFTGYSADIPMGTYQLVPIDPSRTAAAVEVSMDQSESGKRHQIQRAGSEVIARDTSRGNLRQIAERRQEQHWAD